MNIRISGSKEKKWHRLGLGISETKWYKWFAWYPVCVGQVDTRQLKYPYFKKVYEWVWLAPVLRKDKYFLGGYGGSYTQTEYIRYE